MTEKHVIVNKLFQRKIVLLQYGAVGSDLGSNMKVRESDAGLYVAIDRASGGYPYSTHITYAHDFKTPEKALEYSRHCPGFLVREVLVTYEHVVTT